MEGPKETIISGHHLIPVYFNLTEFGAPRVGFIGQFPLSHQRYKLCFGDGGTNIACSVVPSGCEAK